MLAPSIGVFVVEKLIDEVSILSGSIVCKSIVLGLSAVGAKVVLISELV